MKQIPFTGTKERRKVEGSFFAGSCASLFVEREAWYHRRSGASSSCELRISTSSMTLKKWSKKLILLIFFSETKATGMMAIAMIGYVSLETRILDCEYTDNFYAFHIILEGNVGRCEP